MLSAKLEFTFPDAISIQLPIALWGSGGQDSNNLSLDGKIRSWVHSIIMSQTSVNLHHHVSTDFWELCHFALAEDLALCNEMFSHSCGDMPSSDSLDYRLHGLKRETLLGRQQDTQYLWMCVCFHEISLNYTFRVCFLEMAKWHWKGRLGIPGSLKGPWSQMGRWVKDTGPGTASGHTKLTEGLVDSCLWISILT